MRAIAFVLFAACGAQPNQPVLANVPKPNTGAVAGAAAAAAAGMTLASPDSHHPEQNQPDEKKPVRVKETVPASVFDKLDKKAASARTSPQNKQPADASTDEPTPTRDAPDLSGQP